MRVFNYNVKDIDFPFEKNPHDADCILVGGGDGSLLHSIQWIDKHTLWNVPVLGYNLGHVGFLSNDLTEEQLYAILKDTRHERAIEKRNILFIMEGVFSHENNKGHVALNEVVIQPQRLGKLFEVTVSFPNDHRVDDIEYKGDGLIISTASGSTAYNLSAGGPIMHPSVKGLVMTPICPFSLAARPIVIPLDTFDTHLIIKTKQPALFVIDGEPFPFEEDEINIKVSLEKLKLLKYTNFFDAIRNKLGWNDSIK